MLHERPMIRQVLIVIGICGGYQCIELNAVIPERVMAKLDFRVVPDQKPNEIECCFDLISRHSCHRLGEFLSENCRWPTLQWSGDTIQPCVLSLPPIDQGSAP